MSVKTPPVPLCLASASHFTGWEEGVMRSCKSPQYVLCCSCKQSPAHREKGKLGSICLCTATGSRRKRAPKTGNVSQLIRRTSGGFGIEAAVFPNMNDYVDVKMQMLHKIVKKRRKKEKAVN